MLVHIDMHTKPTFNSTVVICTGELEKLPCVLLGVTHLHMFVGVDDPA